VGQILCFIPVKKAYGSRKCNSVIVELYEKGSNSQRTKSRSKGKAAGSSSSSPSSYLAPRSGHSLATWGQVTNSKVLVTP
jgi:hypothetical protein